MESLARPGAMNGAKPSVGLLELRAGMLVGALVPRLHLGPAAADQVVVAGFDTGVRRALPPRKGRAWLHGVIRSIEELETELKDVAEKKGAHS